MIFVAFALGLMGSFHCAGMCGPIALAVPVVPGHRWFSALTYLLSKALAYALLGVLVGLFGWRLQLAGWQSYLSIAAGVIVLIWLLAGGWSWSPLRTVNFGWLQQTMARFLRRRSYPGVAGLGFLNGLLPCGLVYIAMVGAAETGYVESAALFMFTFGLGTSGLLFLVFVSKERIATWRPAWRAKMVPVFTFLLGLFFIARGVLVMLPDTARHPGIDLLKTITMCHGR